MFMAVKLPCTLNYAYGQNSKYNYTKCGYFNFILHRLIPYKLERK
jgi:hypothetical protein